MMTVMMCWFEYYKTLFFSHLHIPNHVQTFLFLYPFQYLPSPPPPTAESAQYASRTQPAEHVDMFPQNRLPTEDKFFT